MKRIFQKPFIYYFLLIFAIYLILNLIFSGFYNTIPLIIVYAGTLNWLKLGFSLVLTLVIGSLVSMTMILAYIKYRERKSCKGVGFAGIGGVGGLVVGICPLCITGLFPLILSVIGISFSFASLPFHGIEVQILIIAILGISIWMLSRNQ